MRQTMQQTSPARETNQNECMQVPTTRSHLYGPAQMVETNWHRLDIHPCRVLASGPAGNRSSRIMCEETCYNACAQVTMAAGRAPAACACGCSIFRLVFFSTRARLCDRFNLDLHGRNFQMLVKNNPQSCYDLAQHARCQICITTCK